jgi:serine/threonine-protein kinase
MTSGPELLLERIRSATADEYHIEREIGRGGMAAVFLARDIALERRVAIKVMLPDLINVHGVQDRFVIEARTAAHLDHPGIVTVYAVKQRAGLLFIVMKYIEGHTLEGVLRAQGRLDPIAVALIGSKVAESLHFAHGEGIVHRDVKPSNIMIDARGRPVVTDFGIARVMTAQSITVAGSMLGTPTHMSPEQCRGLPATAASDQYALGVTLYEMLTGRVPFTGTLFELISAHREQSPPGLSEFVGGVDPALEHTVMRMLAKEPVERWGSMSDVIQRLAAHTTVQQGDENLRATLMLSGTGSHSMTPERGVAAVDLLTPPGSVAPPPAAGGGSPLSPIPIHPSVPSPPLAPARPVVVERPDTPATGPGELAARVDPAAPAAETGRGLLFGGIGVALMALVAFVVFWTGRTGSTSTSAGSRPDSVTQKSSSTTARDSAVRDSLVRASIVRDSVAKALAARDSAMADSVRADSLAKAAAAAQDSAAKARAAEIARRRAADSARNARNRPESSAVCARLLERQSLGERLTDAERATLLRRCPK